MRCVVVILIMVALWFWVAARAQVLLPVQSAEGAWGQFPVPGVTGR
jgi:hypothetical protein